MKHHLLLCQLSLLAIIERGTSLVEHLFARASRGRADTGQSTAEYALVLLGAASVALLFLAWAGKTSRIGRLFDTVLDSVRAKVT